MPQIFLIFKILVALLTMEIILVLVTSLMPLPVRNAVKNDSAEGASVGYTLAGGEMGHLVLVQFSVKSERSTTDVTLQLVGVFTVLSLFMFHPPTVGGKYCSTFPSADMRFDASMTVHVSLHMSMNIKSFSTNITSIFLVAHMLSHVFFKMLFL